MRYNFVRRSVFIILALLVLQSLACAAQVSSLAKTIDAALADPVLTHGIQGVLVRSLRDGHVLYEKNSDLALQPASNFKLVVSSTALALLGPNFKFQTSIYVTGEQTPEGVLKGDIILVGRGDPVFKSENLQEMADKIKEMGIKSIEGNVIADDTWFDDVPLGWGWAWDDESYYYAAQISALNLNENVVDVWVRPGRITGSQTFVKVLPPTSYLTVRDEGTTTKPGTEKELVVDRARGRNVIRVRGLVPLDYSPKAPEESIAVEDPAIFTCSTLIEMLGRANIEVKGKALHGELTKDARLVMTHDSPELSAILGLLNKPSDNLIAECLFKTLGAKFKGKGSASDASQVELDFLTKAGLDMTAISIIDGSGLSRQDLISPKNMVTLLEYMYRQKNSKVFINSLPIAGVDGTLKKRMAGTAAEGNVKAKTGYLSRISTVSGYVTTKAGEPLVFSIMMNNHLCRNKEATTVQDKILIALAE